MIVRDVAQPGMCPYMKTVTSPLPMSKCHPPPVSPAAFRTWLGWMAGSCMFVALMSMLSPDAFGSLAYEWATALIGPAVWSAIFGGVGAVALVAAVVKSNAIARLALGLHILCQATFVISIVLYGFDHRQFAAPVGSVQWLCGAMLSGYMMGSGAVFARKP